MDTSELDARARRHWEENVRQICGDAVRAKDCLEKLTQSQLNDLLNGNHANAPKELVQAARDLLGCEWLG